MNPHGEYRAHKVNLLQLQLALICLRGNYFTYPDFFVLDIMFCMRPDIASYSNNKTSKGKKQVDFWLFYLELNFRLNNKTNTNHITAESSIKVRRSNLT